MQHFQAAAKLHAGQESFCLMSGEDFMVCLRNDFEL